MFNPDVFVFNLSSIRIQLQENCKFSPGLFVQSGRFCVQSEFNPSSIRVQSQKIASSIQDFEFNLCSILAPSASLDQDANVARLIPGVICTFGRGGVGGLGVSARSTSKEHSLLAKVRKTLPKKTATIANAAKALDVQILLTAPSLTCTSVFAY